MIYRSAIYVHNIIRQPTCCQDVWLRGCDHDARYLLASHDTFHQLAILCSNCALSKHGRSKKDANRARRCKCFRIGLMLTIF